MAKSAAAISGSRKRDRDRLVSFGDFLRRARVERGIKSQSGLADRIKKSQSFVAQLEAGDVLYPDPELLKALANQLGVEYPKLVHAYAQSRFSLSIDASVEKAVGLEVRDVQALAAWEKELRSGELWIVVRKFVDQDVPAIQEAVSTFVKNGGRITYFSDDRAHFEGAKQSILARAAASQTTSQMESSIHFEYVPPQAIRFMMAGVVIYNPRNLVLPDEKEREKCEAFLIVNDGEHPDFGIRINSVGEKRRIFTNILAFLSERQSSQGELE